MSSITTKFGDTGDTRLYSGQTVSKKSKRIWSTGDIDELVSVLGVAYATLSLHCSAGDDKNYLLEEITYIQRKLFLVASEIATMEPVLSRLKERIDLSAMDLLDEKRDALESKVTLPTGFILPGANLVSAHLDVARATSRRCERIITDLYNEGIITNRYLLMWMNRLSDYLYLLARYSEQGNYRMVKE